MNTDKQLNELRNLYEQDPDESVTFRAPDILLAVERPDVSHPRRMALIRYTKRNHEWRATVDSDMAGADDLLEWLDGYLPQAQEDVRPTPCPVNWGSTAESIAADAHSGVYRRDRVTPYITHVADVVRRVAGDPAAEAVAWLHDVLEDEPRWTPRRLAIFGIPPALIKVVEILTKPKAQSYPDYIKVVGAHPLATKVKIADILSNLSDDPTERQLRKYVKALDYLLNLP